MLINCKLYHVTLTRFHVIRFELTIKKKIMFHITKNNMKTQQPIVLIKMVFLGKSIQQQRGIELRVKIWMFLQNIGHTSLVSSCSFISYPLSFSFIRTNCFNVIEKIYTKYCLSTTNYMIWFYLQID